MLSLILSSFLSISFAEENPNTPTTNISYHLNMRSELRDGVWNVQQGVHLISQTDWKKMSIHIDFMDARVWGSEITYFVNKDTLANLYAGYAQFNLTDAQYLRVGKQEFVMNNGRFLWDGRWPIYGRSMDGLVYHGEQGKNNWNLSGFIWKNPAQYQTTCTETSDTSTDCVDFTPKTINSNGDLLFTANAHIETASAKIEPYLLHLRQNPIATDLKRERRVWSPGLRVYGSQNKFYYDLEGVYQFGQASAYIAHQAWMGTAKLGVKLDNLDLALYYEENSGDGDPDDKVDNNMEAFIGKFHGLRGFADQVGGINSRDMSIQGVAKVNDKNDFIFQAHQFQLSKPTGSWYSFNSAYVGTASADNTNANLGSELDVVLQYKPVPGAKLQFGHSIFTPQGAGADIKGSDKVLNFSYIWLVVKK